MLRGSMKATLVRDCQTMSVTCQLNSETLLCKRVGYPVHTIVSWISSLQHSVYL